MFIIFALYRYEIIDYYAKAKKNMKKEAKKSKNISNFRNSNFEKQFLNELKKY